MSSAEFWHRGNKFFVEASKCFLFFFFLIVRHFEACLQNFSKAFQCHQVFSFVTWHLCWLVWFEKVGCNSDICITIVIWKIKTALEKISLLSPLTTYLLNVFELCVFLRRLVCEFCWRCKVLFCLYWGHRVLHQSWNSWKNLNGPCDSDVCCWRPDEI